MIIPAGDALAHDRHVGERALGLANGFVIWKRLGEHHRAAARQIADGGDEYNPVRVGNREAGAQKGVHHREDGRIGAERERHREHGNAARGPVAREKTEAGFALEPANWMAHDDSGQVGIGESVAPNVQPRDI